MIPKYIKILFAVPFVIITCYLLYLCSVYKSVPDTIPIHSFGNNKDSYGSKLFLFLPIFLNLIILLFIWRIIRRPDKIKFTFEIKETEYGKVYHTTQLAMVILAIFVTVMMGPLSFADVVFN
ncbi:hypothetical protein CRN76_16625 [Chryseobacterium indologenes]|uniref:hypothetical protein n=1 Tax=Chryseobacterium indologenes TaxID=253 RepID=UPI000BFDFE00|nr:hypothetical protein [Chryseobacterium indologenes]ATN06911.1 hypothetical protein CRN76_16625 [Chryseobacterium indologenes]AYY84343.1 hypothetical protein EGX91_07170 [Chryseobacterium indologenes]QIX81295.1 hypothetical protein FOB56_08615 [Chryseobacterium indologenes]UDQ55039.1 hypothetical protein LJF28_05055 [Chryseobacterium indologenes]HAO29643.1 hypothetical protein [Chryseobacterium indologenes]